MEFEDVLPHLKVGRRARRKTYPSDCYIYLNLKDKELNAFISFLNRTVGEIKLMTRDLLAKDWEIIEEKKKIRIRDLTEEQLDKWREKNCSKYNKCEGCPFENVRPYTCDTGEHSWIKNKKYYFDHFLDKEIEIEE